MKQIYFDDIENFAKEHDFFFLYCFTNWCGECKMNAPIIENITKKWGEKVEIAKIDVDEEYMWNGEKNGKFEILSVPTFLLFKNGEEIWREQNFKSEAFLEDILAKYVKK